MARREFKGAAIPTRLTGSIGAADTSFTINNNAGWPTGGANGPFTVIFEPDVAGKEEHVLVTSQAGGVCSGVTRGFGDTTATTHSVGVDGSVIHGTSKVDYDEANRHINVTTDDNHTQYMMTDGTRHDLNARHLYGAALGTRPTPVAVGTALAPGTGAQAAAGDHVHIIGSGAINASAMFAADVVNAAAVGPLAIGSSELNTAAVIAGKIAAGAIDDHSLFSADTQPVIVQGTNPGAVGAGRVWLNTTKRALLVRNAANTGWEVIQAYGPSIAYTPTLFNFTIGTGTNEARYRRHGGSIIADGYITLGASSTTSSALFGVGLPTPAADYSASMGSFYFHGASRGTDGSGGVNYAAVGLALSGDDPGAPFSRDRITAFATAGTVGWNNVVPFTWEGGTGDAFSWFVEYEPASYEDTNYV